MFSSKIPYMAVLKKQITKSYNLKFLESQNKGLDNMISNDIILFIKQMTKTSFR